jgi:hypothetical protein
MKMNFIFTFNNSSEALASRVLQGERYARERSRWRSSIIAHKRERRVSLGDVDVLFESRATVLFQLQEVLLVESIRSPRRVRQAIEEHVALVPGPARLTASVMLCAGSPDDSAALGGAISRGELMLDLEGFQASAQAVDDGDTSCPVRYVAFTDWREGDGDRQLRLGDLCTDLNPSLARTLSGELALAPKPTRPTGNARRGARGRRA